MVFDGGFDIRAGLVFVDGFGNGGVSMEETLIDEFGIDGDGLV